MNRILLLILLLVINNSFLSVAQSFSFSLEGNPVDISNWELGSLSSVQNEEIVLTNATSDQNGYIYYQTPQNLASCSEFTVEFEFQITQSSNPTADGISFFYITNPPSGFISGEGIGLPTNPEGIILVLDTYNNDNLSNNPLISLRNMPGNINYIEGNSTNNIVPDVTHQSFITNGQWHKCKIHFAFGEISVSFNDQPPLMAGNTTMNLQGYFGFSSSTGGSWARHAIKNVHIYGASEPEKPEDKILEFCQGEEVGDPIEIIGENIKWYTDAIGGNELPEPPIINTSVAGTTTYYVAETVPHCNLESERAEIKIIVHPKAMDPTVNIPIYCSGQTNNNLPLVMNSSEYEWYLDELGTQQITPIINTSNQGERIFYVANISSQGCKSDIIEVVIPIHQTPILDFEITKLQQCDFTDSLLINNHSEFLNTYHWTINDTLLSNEVNPDFHLLYGGMHKITLIGSNEYCTDSLTQYVESGHEFVVDFNNTPPYFCENELVFLENNTLSTASGDELITSKWRVNHQEIGNDWDFNNQLFGLGSFDITLEVSNEIGCVDSITKTIFIDPIIDQLYQIKDPLVCQGQSIHLDIYERFDGLSSSKINFGDGTTWENFDYNALQHSYINPGNYTIHIEHSFRACPMIIEQFNIEVKDIPLVQLPTLDEICLHGEKIHVAQQLPLAPHHQYLWSNGDTNPYTEILTPGRYWLEINNSYCIGKEYIDVEEDCFLRLPNAFTPNGDGNNDYFFPRQLISKGLISFEMDIYNRWGQMIFSTQNIDGRGWDGKFNDKEQPAGVYIYKITAVFKNGRAEQYDGNVTLIR